MNGNNDGLDAMRDLYEDGREILRAECLQVFTNCRGYCPALGGKPFDGGLDGFSWHAWAGPFIGYGADEQGAVRNLLIKAAEGQRVAPFNLASTHEATRQDARGHRRYLPSGPGIELA